MIGYLLRSIRDFTRLCRVALLRVFRRTALLCGTAQCSASLSPPPAALSFAYPEPASAGPGFKPAPLQNKAALSDGFFFLVGHQGLYPVVPCRTAARSSAARIALRHCPMLRFAFSAAGGAQLCIPRTRPGGSRIQARPSAKQKAALSDGFSFWWGIRDLNPGPAGYEPDALTN